MLPAATFIGSLFAHCFFLYTDSSIHVCVEFHAVKLLFQVFNFVCVCGELLCSIYKYASASTIVELFVYVSHNFACKFSLV